MATQTGKQATFYGKLNLVHGFGGGDRVWLGNPFRIGDFGTHIEGGFGLHADLSTKAMLYGDVAWAERVNNAGTSGISFNAGLRVGF